MFVGEAAASVTPPHLRRVRPGLADPAKPQTIVIGTLAFFRRLDGWVFGGVIYGWVFYVVKQKRFESLKTAVVYFMVGFYEFFFIPFFF